MQAHNQYREKYNIPFPEEIAAIREKYKLSAAKMSEVLGLGASSYSNYEKGEMPVPAMAKLITTSSKPSIFKEFLVEAKNHFSDNAFEKAKEKVEFLIARENEKHPFYSSINIYNEQPGSGFQKLLESSTERLKKLKCSKTLQKFSTLPVILLVIKNQMQRRLLHLLVSFSKNVNKSLMIN